MCPEFLFHVTLQALVLVSRSIKTLSPCVRYIVECVCGRTCYNACTLFCFVSISFPF